MELKVDIYEKKHHIYIYATSLSLSIYIYIYICGVSFHKCPLLIPFSYIGIFYLDRERERASTVYIYIYIYKH